MTFSEFITRKYVEWRGNEVGNSKSIAKFARNVLGIEPYLLGDWMNRGKVPTEDKYINMLKTVFADDLRNLYEALGMELSPFDVLPKSVQDRILPAVREFEAALAERKITNKDSPEAARLWEEIGAAHGLGTSVNFTDHPST